MPALSALREWTGRAVECLSIVIGILILVACRTGKPNETRLPTPTQPRRPPASATATPEPTSTASKSYPAPTPLASPTPTSAPTATVAEPERRPTPTYDQALRPSFRSDDNQFPNATRYRLDLALDLGEATLSGSQQVSYTNTETVPLDALYLRLFPNTPGYGGEMSVTNLTLDGERIEPVTELQGSALRVVLDPPLTPGTHTSLTLDFTLALPTESREASEGYRQLGIYEDVVALANAYPIIPVYDDEGWNVELAPTYGDAVFSDVAFFDVSVTVNPTTPRTMTLAASGTCTPAEPGAAKRTWSCVAAPMRDFNVLLGEDYQLESHDMEGITVNSLFYTGHAEGGAAALDYASQAIRLFNARIGPYPFTELDVVETPTLAGGIEYPGLVVINQSYYQDGFSQMEWVVVHEVLHQWWYSLVGNDQVDEPWLDEALAQYCTLLYYEEQYGEETAERLLESLFQRTYQELQETGRDQPVGLPVAGYGGRNYGPVVYQKGPLYFHDLRQQVGLETFWEILKIYFEQNRYRIARPEDWLAAVEAVTGSEHRALYSEWIQETGG